MAKQKTPARKVLPGGQPRGFAKSRRMEGPSQGGIGQINPHAQREAVKKWLIEETKKLIKPFRTPLSSDGKADINRYHPDYVRRDVGDESADHREFCVLNRSAWEKPAKLFVAYTVYERVILDKMLDDSVLSFLVASLDDSLSTEMKSQQSIRFVTNQAMLYLASDSKSRSDPSYFKPRKGQNGTVKARTRKTAFFGDRNFTEWDRIFFPVYVNHNHFVAAVVSYKRQCISTLDSLSGMNVDGDAFEQLSSFLNLVLKSDDMSPVTWNHERLESPQQSDTVNCGLFTAINGIIATILYDDLTAAKEIFIKSKEAAIARMQLAHVLIVKGTLSHSPEGLKHYIEQQSRSKDSSDSKGTKRIDEHDAKRERYLIDLCSSSSEEEDNEDEKDGKKRKSELAVSELSDKVTSTHRKDDNDDRNNDDSNDISNNFKSEQTDQLQKDSKGTNEDNCDDCNDGGSEEEKEDNLLKPIGSPLTCALGRDCARKGSPYSGSLSILISCTSCGKDVHSDSCTSKTERGVCLLCNVRRKLATSDRKRKASADDRTLPEFAMPHKKNRAEPSEKEYVGGVLRKLSLRLSGQHFLIKHANQRERESGKPSNDLYMEDVQCLPIDPKTATRNPDIERGSKEDLFRYLEEACQTLREGSHSVERRDDNLFRMTSAVPLLRCLHNRCDRIELIDYARRNNSTCKIILRNAVPSDREHQLLQILEQQLLEEDFQDLLKSLEKNSGGNLRMVAAVSLYRSKRVEKLQFNSFIVFEQRESSPQDIFIAFKWSMPAFIGLLDRRLVQIAVMSCWKLTARKNVRIVWNEKNKRKKKNSQLPLVAYRSSPESLDHIFSRMLVKRGKKDRFDEDNDNTITIDHRSKMKSTLLSALVAAKAYLCADIPTNEANNWSKTFSAIVAKFSGGEKAVSEQYQRRVPLSIFTHQLTMNGIFVSEVMAEFLQMTEIQFAAAKKDSDENCFTFYCNCCKAQMTVTPLNMVSLMKNGVDIIVYHHLRKAPNGLNPLYMRMEDTQHAHPAIEVNKCKFDGEIATDVRRLFYDALAMDNGMPSRQERRRNSFEICKLLFSDKEEEVTDSIKLLMEVASGSPSNAVSAKWDQFEEKYKTGVIKEYNVLQSINRPVQLHITDVGIDPISSFPPHKSWDGVDLTKYKSRLDAEFSMNGDIPCPIGRAHQLNDKRIYVLEDDSGVQGEEVKSMLSWYYCGYVLRLDRFQKPKNLIKNLKDTPLRSLPQPLKDFLDTAQATKTVIVIISDLTKSTNKAGDEKERLDMLSSKMKSDLSWFLPSTHFMTQLPKDAIDNLFQMKSRVYEIPHDVRNKFRQTIDKAMRYEISKVELLGLYPNFICKATTSSGNCIYIDGNHLLTKGNVFVEEPWILERLTSQLFSSTGWGVSIGAGKSIKQKVANGSTTSYPQQRNFWTDSRNANNLCVVGSIVNWLHDALSTPLEKDEILSTMKEAFERDAHNSDQSQNLTAALKYLRDKLHILNVIVNLKKDLSIPEVVKYFKSFPAPCIALLSSAKSLHLHAVVLSNGVVYDVQNTASYELTIKNVAKNFDADNDIVALREVRYFCTNNKRLTIANCPKEQLAANDIPMFNHFVKRLGSKKNKKKNKKK